MSLSRLLIDYNHNLFDEILLDSVADDIDLEVYSSVIKYLEDHPIIKRRKKEKRRNYIETEWGRLIWGAHISLSSCLYDINTGRVVKSYNSNLDNIESRDHKLFTRRFRTPFALFKSLVQKVI
jgi:hypothetical protein